MMDYENNLKDFIMSDNTNDKIYDVKFEYVQKSLDRTTKDVENIRDDLKTFELDIQKSITAVQTKLTIYISIVAMVASYVVNKFMV